MRCALFVVQDHTLPSQTFFEPVIAQIELRHGLLQVAVLTLEASDFISVGFTYGIARKTLLASLKEVLTPAVIRVGVDAFLATQFSDGAFSPQTIQDNADLLLG